MKTEKSTIFWTWTDEAPALATLSFLPIVQAFTKGTGISLEMRDISLAGRIIANFPEHLTESAAHPGLSRAARRAHAGPRGQYHQAAEHLAPRSRSSRARSGSFRRRAIRFRTTPKIPKDDAEKAIQAQYAKVLGSAVNPVIREGNSDRRSPLSVKEFARKHPKRLGAWSPDSKTHVAHMTEGDFYGSEKSVTIDAAGGSALSNLWPPTAR